MLKWIHWNIFIYLGSANSDALAGGFCFQHIPLPIIEVLQIIRNTVAYGVWPLFPKFLFSVQSICIGSSQDCPSLLKFIFFNLLGVFFFLLVFSSYISDPSSRWCPWQPFTWSLLRANSEPESSLQTDQSRGVKLQSLTFSNAPSPCREGAFANLYLHHSTPECASTHSGAHAARWCS